MAEAATPKQVLVYADAQGKEPFTLWLHALRDRVGRQRILARVTRLAHGNYGDHAPVGEGVSELRLFFFGPGYRVYVGEHGATVVVLLSGGEKRVKRATLSRRRPIGGSINSVNTYRTIQEVEEAYLRQHPDEIEDDLTVLFDEYAHDGNTAALLLSPAERQSRGGREPAGGVGRAESQRPPESALGGRPPAFRECDGHSARAGLPPDAAEARRYPQAVRPRPVSVSQFKHFDTREEAHPSG